MPSRCTSMPTATSTRAHGTAAYPANSEFMALKNSRPKQMARSPEVQNRDIRKPGGPSSSSADPRNQFLVGSPEVSFRSLVSRPLLARAEAGGGAARAQSPPQL